MSKKCEILAPAGDTECLHAALSAGADAIYLGADLFNARKRAKNFTLDELEDVVQLCHAHKTKLYVTLNTQLYEKELPLALSYVDRLYQSGVDALIVADFGVASLINKRYPDLELHASTQASVHSLDGASLLAKRLGFTRVVLARELSQKNIEYISKNAPCETEIFVHGAHCMSVSGQCLMSYSMGGRSGNRGECAQPCRLPYRLGKGVSYPLSLKDMCLGAHVTEIVKTGTASLKIEGRMKGPQYVYSTVSKWRELLDSNRNASDRELLSLGAVFSRQGFSDGYFTERIDKSMLGIRSEADKNESKENELSVPPLSRIKVSMRGYFHIGEPARLTLILNGQEFTAYGEDVSRAINAPSSEGDIIKSLSKLGATPFELDTIDIDKDENIMVRVSCLNSLRRECVKMAFSSGRVAKSEEYLAPSLPNVKKIKTALFASCESIPETDYFDIKFVYLDKYKSGCLANGVCLPPVILDDEWEKAEAMLRRAQSDGISYALVGNIGHIERVRALGFKVIGDFRLNAFNKPCVELLMSLGLESLILSPELSLAQLRDFYGYGVIAYGKFPVMTTHKCILKDTYGCLFCHGYLADRQNARLFVHGTFGHRNIIYNSVPVYMADRLEQINTHSLHFIFSDETKNEVLEIIDAYKRRAMSRGDYRRIK